ncbi:MAG: zinc metallopeptidase [Cellvibrionaceae bacterium]
MRYPLIRVSILISCLYNMIYALSGIAFLLLAYGPSLWVRFVLRKHSDEIAGMPGTGGELAEHLVERFQLDGVSVEQGQEGQDHYSPADKVVSLSPSIYKGKSLTAVAVAAHEVGHAIQFSRNEPVSQLRTRYLGKAFFIKRIGTGILLSIPIITLIFKAPHVILFAVVIGIITLLASALIYLAVLPEEYDASFNKALPILQEGYVHDEHIPAIRQVLRAAALTYFAGALADILSLWRWFSVFR